MLTIQAAKIREVILDTVQVAVKRVVREKRKSATSLGILFNFRFGTMSIAINDDDDESFRCPYFEYFQQQNWASANFDDLVDLEDALIKAESDVDNVVLVDQGEHEKLGIIEDVCLALFPKAIRWVTEWFHAQPPRQWQPIWLRFEEGGVGRGETIGIATARKIPRRKRNEEETSILRGLPPPKKGAKVFVISYHRDRKYAGLWPTQRTSLGPWFMGKPLAGEYDGPVPVKLDPEGVRRGDLAKFEGSFAYLDSGAKTAAIARYLDSEPHIERFPLFDAEQNWTAIHPLNPVPVLDTNRTLFDWQPDKRVFEGVRIAEFDPEALRRSGRSIFKLVESPYLGPFFLEDELKSGFLSLCEKLGLRGLVFDMIWCEDLSEVIPQFEEFMQMLRFRLKRKIRTTSIKHWEDVTCLYGVQKNFWRIGEFREVFNKSGAEAALKHVPDISWLIRSLIPHAFSQATAVKQPFTKQVIREIDDRFGGKEILNEVRGRLCREFLNAFSSLKEMESSGK